MPGDAVLRHDLAEVNAFEQMSQAEIADVLDCSGPESPFAACPHEPSVAKRGEDVVHRLVGDGAVLAAHPGDDRVGVGVARERVVFIEEANAYDQLLQDFDCTHDELASRIGRSRPQISNTLRLLKLSAPVQRRIAAGGR